MSQFAPEDHQGAIDLVSDGDVTFESDRNQDGVGDLVFRTAGVERARIKHDGSGTGWGNVLGGSSPYVITDFGAVGDGTTDNTEAIQAALNAAASTTARSRVVLIPFGWFAFSQIVVPTRVVLRGLGWGNYGSLYGAGFESASTSFLFQQAGSNCDAIVFGRITDGVDYAGPLEMHDFILQQEASNTSGSGIALTDVAGVVLATEDGFRISNVQVGGFAEDGFLFNGGVPLHVQDCRAIANLGAGLRYVSEISGNDQAVHFDNFSGDQNGGNLIHIKGIGAGGQGNFLVTNLKSEKADNVYRPTGGKQESALVLEDLRDIPVMVDGLTHVSSVVNDTTPEGCGPAIKIISASPFTNVPKLDWRGVKVRVKVGETSPTPGPAAVYDSTAQDTSRSTWGTAVTSGRYSRGDTVVDSSLQDTPQRRVLGFATDYFGAGGLGEKPGYQLVGPKPTLAWFESDGTSGRRHYAWYADGGALRLATLTDAGAVDETIMQVSRPTSPGGSVTTLRQLMGVGKVAFPGSLAMLRSGRYHFCNPTSGSSSQQLTNDTLYVMPFPVPFDVTLTRIGAEVVTAGSTGSTLLLVIYTDDGAGGPSALSLDSSVDGSASTILGNGLIDTTNVSVQEVTINKTLTAGLYWVGAVVQGTPVTRPFIRSVTSGMIGLGATTLAAMGSGASPIAYSQASVSGAPPASFTIGSSPQGICPRVFVKVA